MLMRTLLGLMVATMFSGLAYAGDGRDAAAEVCKSLYYASDKNKCLKIVEAADYYDERATKICNSLYYASDKIKCIEVTQNKKYLAATLEICEGKYYASDKISCLNAGKSKQKEESTNNAPLSRRERAAVIAGIERAIREIKNGEDEEAIDRLRDLISQIE